MILLLTHRRSAERKVVDTTLPWVSIGGGDYLDIAGEGFSVGVGIVGTRPRIAAAGVSVGVVGVVLVVVVG